MEKKQSSPSTARLIYILYLIGLIPAAGLIASIIGVVLAYINREDDSSDWLQSHYKFQIQTFWLSLIFSAIGWILTFIFIGYIILLFWLFWLIIRCAKGMKRLDSQLPALGQK